ncbi:DsbA family protein [Aquipseudomonas alcaligenes]|uniref:DsbA family protein n=1 Tax=Aquipseudomonas alcaligenes TaxID=43263 RepID=UPI001F25F0E4|nr:DsbA family protein [Pseudomonas alcaligenes]BDC78563.1 hypothetical protein MRCP2_p2980 [Pseudomonas alcaligenes]
MTKPMSPLKLIAISVVAAQVITFGGAFAYKQATGQPVPVFTPSSADLQSSLAGEIDKRIKELEVAKIESMTSGLYEQQANAADEVPDNAHVYGDLRGRFTLAEFSDLECGFCKRLHPTLKEIVDKSNGAVNWQWRHMPLSFHNPVAHSAAHAAECFTEQKGNKGFWVFVDQWFAKSRMNGGGVDDTSALAVSLGADQEKFTACMDSEKFGPLIKEHSEMGARIGATGTPATVIIDNLTGEKEFVSGAQPRSAFVNVMKRMLVESEAKAAKEAAAAAGKPIDPLDAVLQAAGGAQQAKPEAAPEAK